MHYRDTIFYKKCRAKILPQVCEKVWDQIEDQVGKNLCEPIASQVWDEIGMVSDHIMVHIQSERNSR